MRTQHVCTASTQRRRPLLYDFVRLHLMDSVRKSMPVERMVFPYHVRQVRAICRHTTECDEFLNDDFVTVGFGDRFHHTSCSGDVDMPHAIDVQDSLPYL